MSRQRVHSLSGRRTRRARAHGSNPETVLLLGTAQWAAPASARSLARAGFRVIGAWEGGRLAGRTRYCKDLHRIPHASEMSAFLATLHDLCRRERVAAVLPLADELLGAALAGRADDAPWVLVGPTRAEFDAVCDKVRLVETAAGAGIASPAFVVIGPEGRQGPLPRFPAYVKVVSGAEAGRPAGRPVRVEDAQACDDVVSRLVAKGVVVMVQEEINGDLWRFQFVRSGGATAHLAARTLADHPVRVGQPTVSEFLGTPSAVADIGMRMLDQMDYQGAGVIQFILRDGVFFIHDVNLRMPSAVTGTVAAGLDMPRLAVELALGRAPALKGLRIRPVRLVQLPGELAAMRSTLGGVPTGRSVARIGAGIGLAAVLPGRVLDPFDPTDPLPTLAALAALRRRPGRVASTELVLS